MLAQQRPIERSLVFNRVVTLPLLALARSSWGMTDGTVIGAGCFMIFAYAKST